MSAGFPIGSDLGFGFFSRRKRTSSGGLSYSFLGAALPAGVTLTRASTARCPTEYGNWTSLGVDVARLDCRDTEIDPFTGTRTAWGMLFEPAAATNLIPSDNRDLTTGNWTRTNTLAAKSATGIEGSANAASRITASSANGTATRSVSGLTAGARYTLSLFARRVTGRDAVEITIDGGTSWEHISHLLWERSGLYRYQVSFVAAATSATIGIRLATSGDSVDVDWWQLETGHWATSPVAAGATRAADVLTVPALEGTWQVEWPVAAQVIGAAYLRRIVIRDIGGGQFEADLTFWDWPNRRETTYTWSPLTSTWYVGPGADDAGYVLDPAADGSEAHPFQGLTSAAALAAIQGGDVVMLSEEAMVPSANVGSYAYGLTTGWRVAEGTATKPTVVLGANAKPTSLFGGLRWKNEPAWTGPDGNGVYSCQFASANAVNQAHWLFEHTSGALVAENCSRLVPDAALGAAGTYDWNAGTFLLRVRPFTAASPAGRIIYPNYGYWLGSANADTAPMSRHVSYVNVDFFGPRYLLNKKPRDLRFTHCSIRWVPIAQKVTGDDNFNVTFDCCSWDWVPMVWYSDGQTAKGTTYKITLARCRARNVGRTSFLAYNDPHAPGFQSVDELVFIDCDMASPKTAAFWKSTTGRFWTALVANNRLDVDHNAGGGSGVAATDCAALIFSDGTHAAGDILDFLVVGNECHVTAPAGQCNQVVRHKWPDTGAGPLVQFLGNRFHANELALYCVNDSTNDASGSHYFRRNGFYDPTTHYIRLLTASTYDGDDAEFGGSLGANDFYRAGNIADLPAWQALGPTYDPNSVDLDAAGSWLREDGGYWLRQDGGKWLREEG